MVRIGAEAWRAVIDHCLSAAPEEACGILLGRREGGGVVVLDAAACRNAHPGDRRKHFLIDPEQQLAIQRAAREAGLEILGFYHSHLNGSAQLSEEDCRQAHPSVSNVIFAFRDGKFVEARSWRIGGDGAAAEEAIVVEGVTAAPRAASENADGC